MQGNPLESHFDYQLDYTGVRVWGRGLGVVAHETLVEIIGAVNPSLETTTYLVFLIHSH